MNRPICKLIQWIKQMNKNWIKQNGISEETLKHKSHPHK